MQQLIKDFSDGKLSLTQGKVTFVPICNPRAFASNVRFCEDDLNRIFKRTSNPTSYEAKLANEFSDIIDKHDIIIDLR